MKKMKYLLLLSAFLMVGCGKKGYKDGAFDGTAVDNYGGQTNTATARVSIEDGKIVDVYLDTTYTTSDGTFTSKKNLGDDYGMYGNEYGSSLGEWYQQVEALERFVEENQGLDKIVLKDDGKTDSVSGCTIQISALYSAIEDALKKAEK